MKMDSDFLYDVIIIGGSYAGLSAAMSLGRSLRRVLIIDSGEPCNRQTPHSHNFITQDGEIPAMISEKAKNQVLNYSTVTFRKDLAVQVEESDHGFRIRTREGKTYGGEKLILATGIKDVMPRIKGFAECWGITVIHCPYCHGYEFRNLKTGILAKGEKAYHLTSLVHNLTKDVTILTNGEPELTSSQRSILREQNISVMDQRVIEIEHKNGYLEKVIFEDGSELKLDALYAAVEFEQHSLIPVQLGCELTDHGYIKIDAMQKTSVPGVFACGDNSSPMRSIAAAVAAGNLAGAAVNKELSESHFYR